MTLDRKKEKLKLRTCKCMYKINPNLHVVPDFILLKNFQALARLTLLILYKTIAKIHVIINKIINHLLFQKP